MDSIALKNCRKTGPPQGRIKLGGLKISPELLMVSLCCHNSRNSLSGLYQGLTDNLINMTFITTATRNGWSETDFCVPMERAALVKDLVSKLAPDYSADYRPHVGTISLYPTASNPAVLGTCLNLFHNQGFKLQGWATSLSSLVLVCDYMSLDPVVAAITESFELPVKHAPFQPVFKVRQSRWYEESP